MKTNFSRRQFLGASTTLIGGAAAGAALTLPAADAPAAGGSRFTYALNTGTIRGQKLSVIEQFETAAKAGFDWIEPWMGDLTKFVETGGTLKDLRKRADDLNLKVISGIGFPNWVVNDDAQRAKGVEQLKREMDMLAQLGAPNIAAPPAGVFGKEVKLELNAAAERYRAILEIGMQTGVTPMLEIWGASANLNHLADAAYILAKAAHPNACVLSDVFHMYKGGSAPASLRMFGRSSIRVFHMNDYPAQPPRETANDSHRIWPGDGIAPLKEILGHLAANGSQPVLSLELFNAEYYKLPALEAAKTGLAKLKAVAG
jgi:sugar phosphate isomerase/epimerase